MTLVTMGRKRGGVLSSSERVCALKFSPPSLSLQGGCSWARASGLNYFNRLRHPREKILIGNHPGRMNKSAIPHPLRPRGFGMTHTVGIAIFKCHSEALLGTACPERWRGEESASDNSKIQTRNCALHMSFRGPFRGRGIDNAWTGRLRLFFVKSIRIIEI
jgi:hypothetical protein